MAQEPNEAVCRIYIYGIKNCATMQKAFAWCDAHGVAYTFHDYKKLGIDAARLASWCAQVGWKPLVNTRGTTWRKLTPAQQAIAGESQAIALMVEFPSLIKRPVVEAPNLLLVGFAADEFARLASKASESA